MSWKMNWTKGQKEPASLEDEQAKVNELRVAIGPLSGRSLQYCSDACLKRFLRARNWNLKKSEKMLKESIKWRLSYKPEEISWADIAMETETGKVYRANFRDKLGRTVLILRPGKQNTTGMDGQLRQLVFSMENAILNLPPDQEKMVWLIDFDGWSLTNSVPVKTTQETAYILQNRYPERLGLAVLYNPPRIFETFWTIVKPFLDPKTYRKVKFVFKDAHGLKLLEDVFDMEKLDAAFGGKSQTGFNFEEYGKQMVQDEVKRAEFWKLDLLDATGSSQ
ncbi:hypothetical protein O6H91_17G037500 [Diphasiastrum complanatum]|uniref:Uncharacterized protein n=5 Tax=Diphasiastrum complanatum TaxID=34168 RepID=A0ACC2B5U1_DIPCM|nr:hypothetical protein O6H91_17G037500 [Diphasiastrum complanatum]KAJ7525129.1 hypothetical protein O6H91_17G037500 [Diphasiastrum complanatum]KAJ7525130.1 hypothetical protein O6H91_17G037500 [Diphasiastrum complanatum]KAJ7525131.1 hypothetical protein O6H91_17G037500 [Diphasiastrum complanatum]KAJ7525132.1 hypothetical protein O6H91_17G037500 [Diphasiastrum complanatum]